MGEDLDAMVDQAMEEGSTTREESDRGEGEEL
jgi:hypothetical protein